MFKLSNLIHLFFSIFSICIISLVILQTAEPLEPAESKVLSESFGQWGVQNDNTEIKYDLAQFNNNYFTRSQSSNNTNDTDGDNIEDSIDDDDDNDNLPDTWEESWNEYAKLNDIDPLSLFNTKNATDSTSDFDGDGYSNINEYISQTNPYDRLDYPRFPERNIEENYDWGEFLVLVAFLIIITMVAATVIGIYIIRKRRLEDDFYNETFGIETGTGAGSSMLSDVKGIVPEKLSRDEYLRWRAKIDTQTRSRKLSRSKYELEIIGGPDTDVPGEIDYGKRGITRRYRPGQKIGNKNKNDPLFKGKHCLWCDKPITHKYIKKCTGMRSKNNRCPHGPFCSRKCLNEHLDTVPHYTEVEF